MFGPSGYRAMTARHKPDHDVKIIRSDIARLQRLASLLHPRARRPWHPRHPMAKPWSAWARPTAVRTQVVASHTSNVIFLVHRRARSASNRCRAPRGMEACAHRSQFVRGFLFFVLRYRYTYSKFLDTSIVSPMRTM
jgi:hypothetical protein